MSDADAGVARKKYLGKLTAPEEAVGGEMYLAFSPNRRDASYQEHFPSESVETYQGTYSEFDLKVISFVSFEGQDGSDDAVFVGEGICLFGFFLVMNYSNPDFTSDWSAMYFRTSLGGVADEKIHGTSSGKAGPGN